MQARAKPLLLLLVFLLIQIFTSTCNVDITYYPFDTQECKLKFTSWSYRQSEVVMTKGSNGIVLSDYDENSVWELVSTEAETVTTDETAVIFTLRMKRKPSFFLISYIVPIVFLTLLNIATFILPVSYGERASYTITVFLSLAVFLTVFASELPHNSDSVSLLATYLIIMTSLSTAIVLVSLVECRLQSYGKAFPQPPPINIIYRAIYRTYQVLTWRRLCKRRNNQTTTVSPKCDKEDMPQNLKAIYEYDDDVTWNDVIDAIDFISFFFTLLFTFLITVTLTAIAYDSSTDDEAIDVPDSQRFG